MSVIRARSGYQATAKFTTWLYRIAHNRLIDGFRAQGRQAEFEIDVADDADDPPDFPAPEGAQPERMLERAQLAGCLLAAIEALPAAQRDAFLLATEGGLTVEEIANAAGIGFETAKSRLRYACSKLRGKLEGLQ